MVGLAGLLSVKKHPGLRALLIITAVHFGMLAVYDGQKLPYYLVHTVPLLDAILAAWAVTSWRNRAPLVIAMVVAFLGIHLLTTAQRIRHVGPSQRLV